MELCQPATLVRAKSQATIVWTENMTGMMTKAKMLMPICRLRHWDSVLPGKVLQVQYEDIVTDQETQSRRLIDFCGLDWQDACLRFEQNTAPVATASSVQVRQPIYRSATARWKNYAEFLQPLRNLLEQNGIEV